MSRLIDADALIENRFKNDISYNAFVKLVKRQTTIDAIPVVHGHWIQDGEPPMFSLTCSVCGQKYFNHYLQPHANYCSMCGAKMDESTHSNDSNTLDALGEKVKE